MKRTLLFFLVFTSSCLSADTYSLYSIYIDNAKEVIPNREALEEQAKNGLSAPMEIDTKALDRLPEILRDGGVIEVFIQTQTSDAAKGGAIQAYTLTYTEWDQDGNPKPQVSREVGTWFRVEKDPVREDAVRVNFKHVKLERWVPQSSIGRIAPQQSTPEISNQTTIRMVTSPDLPAQNLGPVFSENRIDARFNLKKGESLVIGGMIENQAKDDKTPPRTTQRLIILARSE